MSSIFDHFKKKKEFKEEDILTAHDLLMSEYGWIPLEEFRKLPIPTFFSLLNRIQIRYEKQNEKMPKKMRGR